MVGQDLTQHLIHIETELAKLMESYQDYRSRDIQEDAAASQCRDVYNDGGMY